MANSACLLCLHALRVEDDPSSNFNTVNFCNDSTKIQIVTLYELLRPFLSHQKNINKYADTETCSICQNCSLATREAVEIRDQISKLETRLREKVDTIRHTILDSNTKIGTGEERYVELGRILAIRNYLMDENHTNSAELEDVQVKEEQVQDDCEDRFFDGYSTLSPSGDDYRPHKQEVDDSDPDSSFCILPDTLTVRARAPKRKRSALSPPLRPTKNIKTSEKSKPVSANKEETQPSRRSTRATKSTMSQNLKELFAEEKRLAKEDRVLLPKKPPKKRKFDSSDKPYLPDEKVVCTKWKCTLCERYWPSKGDLNAHLARQKLPCPLCPSTFCASQARDDHLKKVHSTTRPYRCPHCNKKTARQNALDAHIYMKHETNEKTHRCPQCDKKFSLEENFQRHVNLHKVEKTRAFVCDVCDSRFSTREVLDKHAKTHIKSVHCDLCDFKCRMHYLLVQHMRRHTGEKRYKCPHCDETFIDYSTRQRHIFALHETTPENSCHICPKSFFTMGELNAHIRRVHEDKNLRKPVIISCSSCDEKFKTVATMKSHRVEVHGDEPFICDECGGRYVTLQALKKHKMRHSMPVTTERLFKCDVCDASFRTKSSLTGHTQTHTGEGRRHKCPSCGNTYRKKMHVLRHMIHIHNADYEEETRHKCDPCGKGFPTKGLLDWHIRQLHTGDGPKYTCTHCEACYADHTMLTHHIRGHHGIMVGGQRKHSKHWKVKPKQKKVMDEGLSSADGGSSEGANNLTGSVIVEEGVVWGVGQHVWLG